MMGGLLSDLEHEIEMVRGLTVQGSELNKHEKQLLLALYYEMDKLLYLLSKHDVEIHSWIKSKKYPVPNCFQLGSLRYLKSDDEEEES